MTKHTPTPEIYQAMCDNVRGMEPRIRESMPAIRLQNGGKEIAVITATGSACQNLTPEEWADLIVRAVNCHEMLINALEGFLSDVQGMNGMAQRVAQAKAALAKAEGRQ